MKTGLILVDIQNDYFPSGAMELVGIREAGTKAKELLSFFRENRWPTYHIKHISGQENATFFRPDTLGVEIHDDIKPFAQTFTQPSSLSTYWHPLIPTIN